MDKNRKEPAPVIQLSSIKAACGNCGLKDLCLPLGLSSQDLDALESIVQRRRKVKRGEQLFSMGDPLGALYAVRSGAFKSSELLDDGRVQVTGFHLSGELLGIDAISDERHPGSAEALETSEVCELPYAKLETLAREIPGLQHQLLRLMSGEIAREGALLMMLGKMNAEERLLACLLNFSQRQQRLGFSGTSFRLHMSRQDIGDYLGLALETVSRLFSRFQEERLIAVCGKHVEIENMDGLQRRLGVSAGGSQHARGSL